MAKKERQRQVKKAAQKIAGEFFAEHHPPGQMVTVARVEAHQKLTVLTIVVTILPEPQHETPENLKKFLPLLRKAIGDRIRFRKVPEIRLEFDRKESSRRRVEEILDQAE
jgi:ribosome-binding factor A